MMVHRGWLHRSVSRDHDDYQKVGCALWIAWAAVCGAAVGGFITVAVVCYGLYQTFKN